MTYIFFPINYLKASNTTTGGQEPSLNSLSHPTVVHIMTFRNKCHIENGFEVGVVQSAQFSLVFASGPVFASVPNFIKLSKNSDLQVKHKGQI